LGEFREEFLDNARYLISEAYCRIHQKIDIG
jgi:translation initiation factor 3 subunit E